MKNWTFVFTVSVYLLTGNLCAGTYSGGDGLSEATAYQISNPGNWVELMNTPSDWAGKYFKLTQNISLTGVTVMPVGYGTTQFTGTFDGNGHTISGAVIDLPDSSGVGLFGDIGGSNGQIKNLGVVDADIHGQNGVGGLVGYIDSGTVSNCYATGTISGRDDVGGLAGCNISGMVSNCYAEGTVGGHRHVGGLAGWNVDVSGTISDCSATVTVSGYQYIGGLVGYNDFGMVSVCYAMGAVSGDTNIGGLVGYIYSGTVSGCNATGAVSGNYWVGGLVGHNESGTISECYATGTVSDGEEYIGGLVGYNQSGTVSKCNATGAVSGYDYVGGLTGYNDSGAISECYATGTVSNGNNYIGGLLGWNYSGTLSDCYATGIIINGNDCIGGLLGYNHSGTINNCYAAKAVSGHDFIGGLVGWNKYGSFESCHATGSVSGDDYVGGLLGLNEDGSIVSTFISCYATGAVSGTRDYVGGLLGWNYFGTISECNASGTVIGAFKVGGLVGWNYFGTISECNATGAVSGDNSVGGLVGYNELGTLSKCNAMGTVSGYNYAGGLVGSNNSSTISKCYAMGAVSGSFEVGGLLGWDDSGMVSECYAAGAVSGDRFVGGLLGYTDHRDNITSCFWDTDTSQTEQGIGDGYPEPAGIVGKTTEEMKMLSTFEGWNFVTEWFMPFDGYPYLRWELDGRYSGGIGTADRPYEIADAADLLDLAEATGDYTKSFVVINDIDLSGYTFSRAVIAPDTSTLTGFQGTEFCGVFDGGRHVIRNLQIDGTSQYTGLFGLVGDVRPRGRSGIIRNLGLVNGSARGGSCIGLLVGQVCKGTVSECFTTGTVRSSGSYAGGLVGYIGYNGGGVLYDTYGSIVNCYSRCDVNCGNYNGGLVGMNYKSSIVYSYSTGYIKGLTNLGGLVGAATTGGNYEDTANFWDRETSRIEISAMGVALSTPQMKSLEVFTEAGWDFAAVWAICDQTNYPRLQRLIPAADWVCPDGVAMEDFAYLADRWMRVNCAETGDCEGADLNHSGDVETSDLITFAAMWLQEQ